MQMSMNHIAFLEAMQGQQEGTNAHDQLFATFLLLRCVDQWYAEGPESVGIDSASGTSARTTIARLQASPVSTVLTALINQLQEHPSLTPDLLVPKLRALADGYRSERHYGLAEDIYQTLLPFVDEWTNAGEAIDIHFRIAGGRREMGHLDEAERRYKEGKSIAHWAKDKPRELMGRLGLAICDRLRGRFTAAEIALYGIVPAARKLKTRGPLVVALETQAMMAYDRGDFEAAAALNHEGLGYASELVEQERLLNNLGATFIKMHHYGMAWDALLLQEALTETPNVQLCARLNLMSVAARRGDADAFLRYRALVTPVTLAPVQAVSFEMESARGFRMMGDIPGAKVALERARQIGRRYDWMHVEREAKDVLAEVNAPMRLVKPFPTKTNMAHIAADLRTRAKAIAA